MSRNLFTILLFSVFGTAPQLPSTVTTVRLRDATPVEVRLLQVIDSERSKQGDSVAFVVTNDVFCDGIPLIQKGSVVLGVIVRARQSHWGFVDHSAKLAFAFTRTTAADGQEVRLRASAVPNPSAWDRVSLARSPHHAMWWAAEGNTFTAYVDGYYDISAASNQIRSDRIGRGFEPVR